MTDFLLCLQRYQVMKRFLITTLAAILPLVMPGAGSLPACAADQSNDVFLPIAKYIAAADVESLSAWFAPSLELTMLNTIPSDCSKAQARQILRAFFKSYPPDRFTINHQAGRGTLKYAIGRLESGENHFSVTIFISYKEGKGYQIQQIKIERE